jgi:hypothetical protein
MAMTDLSALRTLAESALAAAQKAGPFGDLRAKANAATGGPWTFEHTDDEKRVVGKYDDGEHGAEIAEWIRDKDYDCYCDGDGQSACASLGETCGHEEVNRQGADADTADATFIAAANPDIVLPLLDAAEPVPTLASALLAILDAAPCAHSYYSTSVCNSLCGKLAHEHEAKYGSPPTRIVDHDYEPPAWLTAAITDAPCAFEFGPGDKCVLGRDYHNEATYHAYVAPAWITAALPASAEENADGR